MTNQEIRNLIISRIGAENFNRLQSHHLAILDEAIESITSGKSLFNGQIPQTDQEILACTLSYFISANQAFEALLKTAFQDTPQPSEVIVNYRDQEFRYSSPPPDDQQ